MNNNTIVTPGVYTSWLSLEIYPKEKGKLKIFYEK